MENKVEHEAENKNLNKGPGGEITEVIGQKVERFGRSSEVM